MRLSPRVTLPDGLAPTLASALRLLRLDWQPDKENLRRAYRARVLLVLPFRGGTHVVAITPEWPGRLR
jgi:hypothetical protein